MNDSGGRAGAASLSARNTRMPGETGLWVFIAGDLVLFSLYFLTYMFYRADDVQLYARSQATLHQGLGALNTILLLTSSLFVALGVRATRIDQRFHAPRMFCCALVCGLGFGAVKAVEWGEKFSAGVKISTNDFYMFYFMLTGIHLLHVCIGICALTIMVMLSRRANFGRHEATLIECGAIFWHLVDLLWIILFALLYLLK